MVDIINNDEIERFLKTLNESSCGTNQTTHWPLSASQITPYFDADEALDIYNRLKKLKETHSIEEISKLMPNADIIRNFMTNNAIIGLKVAKKFNIAPIKQEDILDFTHMLLEIIKTKVKNDSLCLDGKNYYYTEKEIQEILNKTNWDTQLEFQKKKIGQMITLANNLCYTLFYDVFMVGGFAIHGPYNVSERFGENTKLIIRDYYDLFPKELWPELEMPFKSIKLLTIYKDLNAEIDFVNHIRTKDTIADKIRSIKIIVDNQEVPIEKTQEIIELLSKRSLEQSKKIRYMSDQDKVRKGAEIAYYLFKNLRISMGDDWKRKEYLEDSIKTFGNRFIEENNPRNKPKTNGEKINIFDPRHDKFQ